MSPVPSLFDEPEADAAAEVYPVARPKDTEAGAGVPAPGRVADLTVIPLADAAPASDWSAEDVAEDVYGGPGLAARFRAAWQWTARTAFLAALLAFVAFTAVTWETWFPQAAHVGEATFHEIDRHARARELAEQQNRVLAEAKERLPYLTPETVRLILSHSPTGVLEIPDIFEAACDAADWGSWALTGPEAEELEVLRRQLFGTLAPIDRGRVAQYEEARENGLVFPLDNRLGALMWARGARALGPDEQERLRELLGKAVAAGLTPGRAPASATYRP